MCDYLVEEESLHGNFFWAEKKKQKKCKKMQKNANLKKNKKKSKSQKKCKTNAKKNKSPKKKHKKKCDPTRAAKTKNKKNEKKKGKQNPFAQKGFYPTKSLQAPIWIEKIGPLKLFVVLVPGLLCNFGWEVTIKIHYSTVSGGVTPS